MKTLMSALVEQNVTNMESVLILQYVNLIERGPDRFHSQNEISFFPQPFFCDSKNLHSQKFFLAVSTSKNLHSQKFFLAVSSSKNLHSQKFFWLWKLNLHQSQSSLTVNSQSKTVCSTDRNF